ncbi:hypothetical protein C8F01DRAFT_1025439 [Mycena amicta]|nr:hypothetical protein C8F01DRAFT_1025439 [Mycena amicta]
MTEPASKRKRVESNGTESATEKLARSDIWMPYGDIVLQAESTQFRVNRDVLAKQSTVFADMFLVPQPPNEPTIEGCPVVLLAGDSAKDWTLLLESMYEPYKHGEQIPLDVLSAMLKLGQKYQMSDIRKHAVALIHYEFPKTLSEYDRTRMDGDWEPTRIKEQTGLELELLNLAVAYGIETSVPTLGLVCLKRHSMKSLIYSKLRRPDGSYILLESRARDLLSVAAEKTLEYQQRLLHWLEFDDETVVPAEDCEHHDHCGTERASMHRSIFRGWCISAQSNLLLSPWPFSETDLCNFCEAAAKERWQEDLTLAWEALPSLFLLPDWKRLKDTE